MSFILSTSGAMKRIDDYHGAWKSPHDFPVKTGLLSAKTGISL